jgi:hypothetical protein
VCSSDLRSNNIALTSACTRPPTALFFKGYAPAKALVGGRSLAGPVSGDARRWVARRGLYRLSFADKSLPLDFEEIFDRINQIDRTKIFKIWFKSGFNKKIRMIPMNKD